MTEGGRKVENSVLLDQKPQKVLNIIKSFVKDSFSQLHLARTKTTTNYLAGSLNIQLILQHVMRVRIECGIAFIIITSSKSHRRGMCPMFHTSKIPFSREKCVSRNIFGNKLRMKDILLTYSDINWQFLYLNTS